MSNKKKLCLRVAFDITCVILVAVGILAIKFGTKPYHRGFFCDDESIKHPVLSDTISVPLATCVGILLPLAVIIIIEFILRKDAKVCIISLRSFNSRRKSWIAAAYNAIAAFVFGMSVTQFLTEVGKYSIGRLRPHFLTLCNPDWTKVNCNEGYIEADVCTSTDESMMTEARLSFPSGHSSFSMYCMLFLILYLQARVTCQALILLKPLLQLIFFSLGFFTCLSRISDYKHHWSDVLSGAILGMVVCVLVVASLTDFGKFLCSRGLICSSDEDMLVQSRTQTVDEHADVHYNRSVSKHESSVPSEPSGDSYVVNMGQIE